MKQLFNRHTALMIFVASVVLTACVMVNLRVRTTHDGGAPIHPATRMSRTVRLDRATGWPNNVVVRTNWATISANDVEFDDLMRPNGVVVDRIAGVKNLATAAALSLVACFLVSAVYRRQFTIRLTLAFTFCVAILIVLLGPQ